MMAYKYIERRLISIISIVYKNAVDRHGKTTWRDINMTTQTGNIIKLDCNSVIVYDESDTIFVSVLKENAVYAFSVKIRK